jgi:general secretion pathway protein M
MVKSWWESLNEREHTLVMGGGSAVLVVLFFLLVWLPLASSVDDTRALVAKQQTLNSWATGAIKQIKAASGSQIVGSGGSLSQTVNQSSRHFNINITRMNPKDNELQLWLDDVVFNDLMKWLAHLEQSQGLLIHGIDVNESSEPGIVNVRRLIIEKR